MNVLVIDVGTSSIRGVLYDGKGGRLFCHQIPYQVQFTGSVRAEQDPSDWSETIVEIAKETASYCRRTECSCDALALTSQRSSIIPVDRNGRPLCPAIMWQDKRNKNIVDEFRRMEGEIQELTGARINTVFSGTKMTWFRRNEPELYKKTYKICTIADFIAHEITGEYRSDHTYGSRSLLMNLRTRAWDGRLLDMFEVDGEKLCELISPGTVLGYVTEKFAEKTGLQAGMLFISGGGDQQCAALGQGVTGPGSVEITTGTGAFMLCYSGRVPENLKNDVICGAHAVPGKYVLESSMLTCAALYNWAKENLFADSERDQNPFERINQAVEASPAGAGGCLVLPYFQGRGTPDWNADAAGHFANVSLGTTRGDMARAILEAIALEVRNNLDIMEGYTGEVNKLYISGGLTKFPTFNQIQADVYQKKVLRNPENAEQTALGAWAGAAVALGLYRDYGAALNTAAGGRKEESFLPDKTKAELYAAKQQEMNRLYRCLSGSVV